MYVQYGFLYLILTRPKLTFYDDQLLIVMYCSSFFYSVLPFHVPPLSSIFNPPSSSLPSSSAIPFCPRSPLSVFFSSFIFSLQSSSFLHIFLSSVFPLKSPFFFFFPPEPVFVDLFGDQESIPSMTGLYAIPICRTGPAGYIGWRNRFLGIDSWASQAFTNTGSGLFLSQISLSLSLSLSPHS
jgi:hypothetical protein